MARGYLHQYQRKYQEAASDFGQVIQLDPSRPEAWFRRAIESFNLGNSRNQSLILNDLLNWIPRKSRIYGSLESLIFTLGSIRRAELSSNLIKRSIPAMLKMPYAHFVRSSYRWSGCRKILVH